MNQLSKIKIQYATFLSLALLTIFAGVIFASQVGIGISPFVLCIIAIATLILTLKSTGSTKKILFFIFSFLEGLSLANILYYYSMETIVAAIVTTLLIGIVAAFIGVHCTKLADSKISMVLFVSLISLLILNILSIFIPVISITFISVISCILFTAFICHDISTFFVLLKRGAISSSDDVINHVIGMLLNIVNLFSNLLFLIGLDD